MVGLGLRVRERDKLVIRLVYYVMYEGLHEGRTVGQEEPKTVQNYWMAYLFHQISRMCS